MVNKKLLEDVAKLGVPLLVPDETVDVNQTLVDVVKSRDVRLWENFPVLFAAASRKFPVNVEKASQAFKSASSQQTFFELLALTKALMEDYHFNALHMKKTFEASHRVYSSFDDYFKVFRGELKNSDSVSVGDMTLSVDRLKMFFEDFLSQQNQENQKFRAKHQELSLEFALSQTFSPRQKELFYKKLNAEKLTKTEREYYSRTVKRKVQALANPDLHRLAQKLLE